jgi:hypothetical protein
MLHIPETCFPVDLLAPATDSAGRTSGVYVSLKNAHRAFIVVYITQGAANTILLSPVQATVVAGTDSKVLANVLQIWSNLDVAAAQTFTKRTAAVNYTTDAGVKNKIVVFQVDPAQMDDANGFDCIGLTTGASSASNITSALLFIEPRYPAAGDAHPSYITD